MNKNNPYGYKVGYRENGSRLFVRYFMTYTYQQALFSQRFYRRHPQRTRDTNRPIVDPFWEIKPITKKEYLAGIWDEIPFLYKCQAHYLYRWAHCSIAKNPKSTRQNFLISFKKSFPLQKFLSFFADFGETLNSYMVCSFSTMLLRPCR